MSKETMIYIYDEVGHRHKLRRAEVRKIINHLEAREDRKVSVVAHNDRILLWYFVFSDLCMEHVGMVDGLVFTESEVKECLIKK